MMNKYKQFSKAKHRRPYIEHFIRSCMGKKKYKSISKAREKCPSNQDIYKCNHCKLYHRGSNNVSMYKLKNFRT